MEIPAILMFKLKEEKPVFISFIVGLMIRHWLPNMKLILT